MGNFLKYNKTEKIEIKNNEILSEEPEIFSEVPEIVPEEQNDQLVENSESTSTVSVDNSKIALRQLKRLNK
jgi:hypothetical protein